MNATGKRRLLKLADFLETAELPGKFHMGLWAEMNGEDELGCGTAACALGWATTIPSFRRAGLYVQSNGTFGKIRIRGQHCETSQDAAERFFDITDDQAEALFIPDDRDALKGRRGQKTVAKRIRQFVKRAA